MKKSEIFKEVLSVVCDCAEVNESDVLCTDVRTEDVSSARTAVVGICKEYGLSNKIIQEFLNLRSHGSITYHASLFSTISNNSRPFRYLLACVRHELDKTMPVM